MTSPLPTIATSGRLTRAVGLVLEAVGLQLPVGSDCLIELPPGYPQRHAEAEVVGFAGDRLFLMPQSEVAGLLPGAARRSRGPVSAQVNTGGSSGDAHTKRLPVGEGMLGRVVDAAGRPLDGLGPLDVSRQRAAELAADEPACARADRFGARRGRARHQRHAHGGPRPAHGPVRRLRAWARACCWA